MRLLANTFLAALCVVLPLLLAASPRAGRPVLVIAAPWLASPGMLDLIGRADGAILRATALPWIALAVSGRGDFPDRLRRAGAWITLDASRVPGCLNAADV